MMKWLIPACFLLTLLSNAAIGADNEVKMIAKASPEQVAQMMEEAAKIETPAFKESFGMGSFEALPSDGGYRVVAKIQGERLASHSGPAKALVIGTIGDESGGNVVQCTAEASKPKPGALDMECEVRGAFHVTEAKPVVIRFGLGMVEQMNVSGVTVEVVTGGARSSLWTFGKLIPLLTGLLMVGYWFFFLRK